MGLLYYILKRFPSLRSRETRVRLMMDIIFYALFFLLIWQARPIYVDYCSTNPSMNVSELKNLHFNESMLDNLTIPANSSSIMINMRP